MEKLISIVTINNLAGETAVGKYPEECVDLLERIIKTYKKNNGKN